MRGERPVPDRGRLRHYRPTWRPGSRRRLTTRGPSVLRHGPNLTPFSAGGLFRFFDDQRPGTRCDDVEVVTAASNVPEVIGLFALAVDALCPVQLVGRDR